MEKTIVTALQELKDTGYDIDFSQDPWKNKLQTNTNDFVIDKTYRFEGMSDPEDEAILFAISSKKLDLKGYLLNGYGVYSEEWIDEIIVKLNIRN